MLYRHIGTFWTSFQSIHRLYTACDQCRARPPYPHKAYCVS
jgi:hypothetical protein